MRLGSKVMTCGYGLVGGDYATQCHDIGYQQWQRKEYHQPAHRVLIVMAWMVTKTQASELWLRRPGGVVYQTRQ